MLGGMLPWLIVGLMFAASAWAWAQTPPDIRLPMQWGIHGQVHWRAPKAVALFFAPALSVLIVGLLTSLAGPHPAELGFPVLVSVVLLIAHAIYVVFAVRDAEEQRGPPASRS